MNSPIVMFLIQTSYSLYRIHDAISHVSDDDDLVAFHG